MMKSFSMSNGFKALILVAFAFMLAACSQGQAGLSVSPSLSTHVPGGSGLSAADTQYDEYNWSRLELGDGFVLRYNSNISLSGDIVQEDDGSTVLIYSSTAQDIDRLTAELFYDAGSFHPESAEFSGVLSDAHIKLALLNLGDRIAAGAAFQGLVPARTEPGEELLRIELERGAVRRISQTGNHPPAGVENKPVGLSVQIHEFDSLIEATWKQRVIGDYDQNGEVGIPDITPVAMYYGTAWGSVLGVVDGDFSGDIGIPDITPIAVNYLNLLTGYNVYLGFKAEGETEYNYELLGESSPIVPRREADDPEQLNSYQYFTELPGYGDYSMRIVPVGPDGVESPSETYAEEMCSYEPASPPYPENQRLTGLDLDYATISWDEITSPLVAEVRCWKSTVGGSDLADYELDATYTETPFATSHTFSDLSAHTDYYFIITTKSVEDVESDIPSPVEAFTDTPPNPPAPSNQVVSDVTPDSATVTWDEITDPLIAEVHCWKSTVGGTDLADYTLDTVYADEPLPTSHTFEGLDVSTTYYFAITSISPLGKESGIETVLEAFTSQAPTAVITGPDTMLLNYSMPGYGYFSGANSTDPDAGDTIAEYRWDWDDGNPVEITDQPNIYHTNWAAADTYTISLVVVDSHGVASAPATHDVEVIQGRTDLLVVYNENEAVVDVSREIAEYYIDTETGRGIDPLHMTSFNWDDPDEGNMEIVRRDYYEDTMRVEIEQFLTDSGFKDEIKYIVLCKGVPLKIRKVNGSNYLDLDYASVDSEMCLLFEDYNLPGRTINPFRAEATEVTEPFQPFTYSYGGVTLSYLVARLDAYTLEEVKAIIDRSLIAQGNTDGYVILDDQAGKHIDMMHDPTADDRPSATTILTDYGANLFEDDTTAFVDRTFIADDLISQNVVGYCSHGVHSANDPGAEYILTGLDFGYRPGAMFITYESFNGSTFILPASRSQGLISDFLRMGGTCGIGNVWEPWSDAVGDESVAFVQYLKGDNAIEALYRSLRYVSWCEVVVGDPLCVITDE